MSYMVAGVSEAKWEDILQDLKLKTAKEQLPGKKVSGQVEGQLHGKGAHGEQ